MDYNLYCMADEGVCMEAKVASGDSTPKQTLIVSGRQKPRSNPLGFNECDINGVDIC